MIALEAPKHKSKVIVFLSKFLISGVVILKSGPNKELYSITAIFEKLLAFFLIQ